MGNSVKRCDGGDGKVISFIENVCKNCLIQKNIYEGEL